MSKKINYFFVFLTLITLSFSTLSAQEMYTISGYMRAADSGEELLYANVYVPENQKGVTTNLYGFYSLTLPKGTYKLQYSYIGYLQKELEVELTEDMEQSVELESSSSVLQEFVIEAEKEDANVTNTEIGVATLDIKEAKLLPVLLGEQDILKTMQLLPGVSASSEGSSGFFVRGGEADQNLLLLDEAPVYNASHLLGFFSVFNSDALKYVKLYKGGIPSQYGGRISSVMDIRMKDGNAKQWRAAGGIGLISSRLTLEGPLVKDKGSIIVSGRRTYADLLVRAARDDFSDLSLYFYDLNMKANYRVNKKNRIFLSAYMGRDVFGTDIFGIDWGNVTGTLRWNHTFSNKMFLNTSVIYSNFDYGFKVSNSGTTIELSAGIKDYNIKQDYNWYFDSNNTIRFGWQSIYHSFKPSTFLLNGTAIGSTAEIGNQLALENGIYVANEQKIGERLKLDYGLRLSNFYNIGPYEEREYNDNDEIINSTIYDKNQFYNPQFGLEPRIQGSFMLTDVSSIKASYNRLYQYLHQLSNSNSGTPTDLWIPTTKIVKPEFADQIALGYFQNFKNNTYEFSVETYYKNLQNQVDYEDGAETFLNADLEAELVFGKGRAYGVELLLRKNKGKFTGWLAYTLAKSERQFEAINDGAWFSARQDRTHDLSIVTSYKLGKKLIFSGVWVYATGDAVTYPSGKYYVDDELVSLYTERNASRIPAYHRLDLGLTWIIKEKGNRYSDLTLSTYNTYDRKNAYSISFRENPENANQTEAVRLSLFGIVPSITWNFKF